MTATPETFKAAWIEDLKDQPTLTSLVGEEIRETEYQSTDWTYPCIRVALDFKPSINRCGPDDGNVELEVYSAQKSSKEATHIASLVYELYHGHPFEANGIKFSTVIVQEITKPDRSIFAWMTKVKVFCQGV
jgi:hypothetical protein